MKRRKRAYSEPTLPLINLNLKFYNRWKYQHTESVITVSIDDDLHLAVPVSGDCIALENGIHRIQYLVKDETGLYKWMYNYQADRFELGDNNIVGVYNRPIYILPATNLSP